MIGFGVSALLNVNVGTVLPDPIKLQMVEIYPAIGNEVNKSVTADVAEILSGLVFSG